MPFEEEDAQGIDFDLFYLPVAALNFFDDPYLSLGDDGYDVPTLKAEVARDGVIELPVAVGKSATDVRERDDHSACTFNGNHRLAVARELGIAEMMCEHSWADDAVPLTRGEIEALGGRIVELPAPKGP